MAQALALAVCTALESCRTTDDLNSVATKYDLNKSDREMLMSDFASGDYYNSLKVIASHLDEIPPEIRLKLNELVARQDDEPCVIPVTGEG
jgi:hypothetical protein